MKYHFEEYNDILRRITELQYKLTEIESELYSIRGVSYEFMPKGNSYRDSKVFKIAEKDEINKELIELKTRKQVLYKKFMLEISLVKDERYRSILRCCYLHRMSNESIADMLNLSISRLLTIKREAVNEFKKVVISSK